MIDIFILNVIINSLFTFVTVSILLQVLLWLIRIKSDRFKAFCLCIPCLKLGYDLFFGYHFSQWALAQGLNPLNCPEGTRLISLGTSLHFPFMFNIGFSLQGGETFTLADCLALWMGSSWTFWLAKGCIVVSLFSLSQWGYTLWQSQKNLNLLYTHSQEYLRPILNAKLNAKVNRYQTKVYLSDKIRSPCVIGIWRPVILFPSSLAFTLTQQEFEAIMAHELDHLRWFDTVIRATLSLFKSLFWWIPLKWLNQKIEFYQEQACDQSGICLNAMAEAIYKTAHHSLLESPMLLHFTSSSNTQKRLTLLLNPPHKEHVCLKWMKGLLMTLLALAFLIGKIWTF